MCIDWGWSRQVVAYPHKRGGILELRGLENIIGIFYTYRSIHFYCDPHTMYTLGSSQVINLLIYMLVSVYLPVTPHYYLIGLIATVVGLLSKVNKNKAAVTVNCNFNNYTND